MEKPESNCDSTTADAVKCEDGRYSNMSADHITLLRRLHSLESHPDYDYSMMTLTCEKPKTIAIEFSLIHNLEDPWEVNEDRMTDETGYVIQNKIDVGCSRAVVYLRRVKEHLSS